MKVKIKAKRDSGSDMPVFEHGEPLFRMGFLKGSYASLERRTREFTSRRRIMKERSDCFMCFSWL